MSISSDGLPAATARGPSARTWWLIAIAGVVGYVALLLAGGEATALAVAGLETIPFIVLALLAYGGLRAPALGAIAWVWLVLVTVAAAALAYSSLNDALPPHGSDRVLTDGALGIAAGLAIGWACALPAVRRMVARVVPIDPHSLIHTMALIAVVSLTIVFTVPLVVLGAPPLLEQIAREGSDNLGGSTLDDLYGLFWLLPAALVAVGWPLLRDWRSALRRLGLVRPTPLQVGVALLVGLGLVVVFGLIDTGIGWLWDALGWPTTDESSFEQLMAYSISPLGALVVGVTAGLGEEVAVRGVLQPRFGLLLSNLFFASLHALQYNFDGLLSVFLVGLILGLVRRWSNTSTSAIVHGVYDFTLIMLSVLSVPGY